MPAFSTNSPRCHNTPLTPIISLGFPKLFAMSFYDEIEIEDMTFDSATQLFHFPCPCGDRFEIGLADLRDGEEVAVCPSCSLMIRVIFEAVSLRKD